MRVSIKELREAFDALVSAAESKHGDIIEVPDDLYWHIADNELTKVELSPTNMTIGSVADDWQQLQQVAQRDLPPMPLAYSWLAGVARMIGLKMNR